MGKNQKGDSLKVPDKAKKILEQYSHDNRHDLVFHDLASLPNLSKTYEVQIRIKTRVKNCNEHLKDTAKKSGHQKEIDQAHCPPYIRQSVRRQNFHSTSTETLPAHVDHDNNRVSGAFIHKDADEALDAVIGI